MNTNRLIAVSLVVSLVSSVRSEDIEVTVKLGTIAGFREKISDKEVNVFLGIPFAVPPIGSLRFRKPQPITGKWCGKLNATRWPKICMQDKLSFEYYNEVSEDCLYLNVWTPVTLNEDIANNMRSVMVYIHGGGFTYMGSSYKHYNAAVLSSDGDVVVVTMNYRLGAFGFLTSGDSDAPGNVGLYDQALALEWIQENIAYFGGDANKVTLFGQSAGAWSVSLHLLSPVSQDTFSRAIIMSGSLFRGVSLDTKKEAIQKTFQLSKFLGCVVENEDSAFNKIDMHCLRNADPKKIVNFQTSRQIFKLSKSLIRNAFVPIIGDLFIPKEPKEMLQEMSFNDGVNVLVGTTANEGFIMHSIMENQGCPSKGVNWSEKLAYFIKEKFRNVSMDEIIRFYFKQINNRSSDEAKMSYYTALGDVSFNCETVSFSKIFSKVNDLYQYLFDYSLVNATDNVEYCDTQEACHGNEIPLTFGTVSHKKDIAVSKEWMKIITDFAKKGIVEWPKFDHQSSLHFKFTGNQSTDALLNNFRDVACKLWEPIFEQHREFLKS